MEDLAARMRALEWFHSLRILPGAWTVVRVDGRSFSALTEKSYEKPFDLRFHEAIVASAQALLEDLQGVYAYAQSDEISVLLRPEWDLFDREVEKVVSISAGVASATFSVAAGQAACFDGRVWLGTNVDDVVDYFRWRQGDCARCALQGWAYWTLRKNGASVKAATKELTGKDAAYKNELLFANGVNFAETPSWQRRGVGLFWEAYEKVGVDPRTNTEVTAARRRVRIERELPIKDDYEALIRRISSS